MAKRPAKPSSFDVDDSPDYLTKWAAQLADALSADELRRLVQDYARQSRNSKSPETDRAFARRRANALRKIVKSHP